MRKKTIAWAVDPFCEECQLVKQTARSVAVLASQWNADVEPVYLLGDVPPNVRLLPVLIREVQTQARSELRHLIKGIQIPGLKDLRLVAGGSPQIREQVDHLVAYAKRAKVDLIAVGTRARKGPGRWILGSFAETLLLRSDVPMFVINPYGGAPKELEHILFPTDFSKESKQAFRQVVEFAKQMDASLTIFHKLRYDLTPAVEVAFNAYPIYKNVFMQEVQARQNDAQELAQMAEKSGVKAEPIVDYLVNGSVAESLLKKSKSRGGMIAMAAHSGPVSSTLLGSTTRQVIRSAPCPVWVVHTEQRKKEDLPFAVTEADVMSDLIEHGRGKRSA